jgi:polyisoprenoid-binding protein YceI
MATETVTRTPSTLQLPNGTWQVDPVHSSVEFHVKHLGIATVKGHFSQFEGTLESSDGAAKAYGTVQVASVDTREPARDAHLRSADFFEVDRYPQITFSSRSIRPRDEDEFEIEGELTIHGVSRPVTLQAELQGTQTDPQGNQRIGISASTQINRSDYDIKFGVAGGSGNLIVADKVRILIEISAVRS